MKFWQTAFMLQLALLVGCEATGPFTIGGIPIYFNAESRQRDEAKQQREREESRRESEDAYHREMNRRKDHFPI